MWDYWDDVRASDTKRRRAPRAKPGELRAVWAKSVEGRDLHFIRGEGVPRADGALLCHALTSKHYTTDERSLAEELHRRGYDLTTLRFSIRKKGEA